jgi:hypothetical protein
MFLCLKFHLQNLYYDAITELIFPFIYKLFLPVHEREKSTFSLPTIKIFFQDI